MLFSGMTPEEYQTIKPLVYQETRKNIIVYAAIVAAAMCVLLLYGTLADTWVDNQTNYSAGLALALLVEIISVFVLPRYPRCTLLLMYAFITAVFVFGAGLAGAAGADIPTVSFIAILLAVPMLFNDKPMRMNSIIIAAGIVYYCVEVTAKSGMARRFDDLNIPIYTVVSCAMSTYLCRIKLRRIYLEQKYIELSVRDHLTGVYNRRDYEEKLNKLREMKSIDFVTFLLLDINDLKQCNDTMGHQAGDEMIRNAASCILDAFSSPGTTYRIGGDEFAVILEHCSQTPEELLSLLKVKLAEYRTRENKTLDMACGAVKATDHPGIDIDGLIKLADDDMYTNKEKFYSESGRDRRRI